ncbi:MAG: hypothetical protein WA432_03305 [Candidatus Babeliaceae bacterium]
MKKWILLFSMYLSTIIIPINAMRYATQRAAAPLARQIPQTGIKTGAGSLTSQYCSTKPAEGINRYYSTTSGGITQRTGQKPLTSGGLFSNKTSFQTKLIPPMFISPYQQRSIYKKPDQNDKVDLYKRFLDKKYFLDFATELGVSPETLNRLREEINKPEKEQNEPLNKTMDDYIQEALKEIENEAPGTLNKGIELSSEFPHFDIPFITNDEMAQSPGFEDKQFFKGPFFREQDQKLLDLIFAGIETGKISPYFFEYSDFFHDLLFKENVPAKYLRQFLKNLQFNDIREKENYKKRLNNLLEENVSGSKDDDIERVILAINHVIKSPSDKIALYEKARKELHQYYDNVFDLPHMETKRRIRGIFKIQRLLDRIDREISPIK